MQLQYRDLIADHDAIAAASSRLLATADDAGAPARVIADQLSALATIVRNHIAVETPLVELLDARKVVGPWLETWQRGRPAYLALKTDWQTFLGDWDYAAIKGDRATFRDEAHVMLARLEERVTMESRTFYALGLQTGSVQFLLH